MNIYLLERDEIGGYDTYRSCVVCAVSEEDAKKIHPNGCKEFNENNEDKYPMWESFKYIKYSTWVSIKDNMYIEYPTWVSTKDNIRCTFIGTAAPSVERGVVCADFCAG